MKEIEKKSFFENFYEIKDLQGFDSFIDQETSMKKERFRKIERNKTIFTLVVSLLVLHLVVLSQYPMLYYQDMLGIEDSVLNVIFGCITFIYIISLYGVSTVFEDTVLNGNPIDVLDEELSVVKLISFAVTSITGIILGCHVIMLGLTYDLPEYLETWFFSDFVLLVSATIIVICTYRRYRVKDTDEIRRVELLENEETKKVYHSFLLVWEGIGVMILGLIILYAIAYSILPVGM